MCCEVHRYLSPFLTVIHYYYYYYYCMHAVLSCDCEKAMAEL